MNSLAFSSIILSIATSVLSAPFIGNQLVGGSYGTPYSGCSNCYPGSYGGGYGGYGGIGGGYGGGYGGIGGGYGGGSGFGINPIIASNDNFVKKDNFNLNEFDHNKEAAVFAENTHKKNVNSDNFVTNNNDNVAIL